MATFRFRKKSERPTGAKKKATFKARTKKDDGKKVIRFRKRSAPTKKRGSRYA